MVPDPTTTPVSPGSPLRPTRRSVLSLLGVGALASGLGALEEWTIINDNNQQHPFHIHTNDFQVISINDEPVAAVSHVDTVNLPANGRATIRIPFLDFTGKFVYHCHILNHADMGMMATVEVSE